MPADTRYIKMFVLDEADEMLSRGFKDQIYDVFRNLNENIQVSQLSAEKPSFLFARLGNKNASEKATIMSVSLHSVKANSGIKISIYGVVVGGRNCLHK